MRDDWPLICPNCGEVLTVQRDQQQRLQRLSCSSGHHYDAAKQGYVNMLVGAGSSFTPDSSAMIMARERVQSAGLFDSVTQQVGESLRSASAESPELLLDCGAGTGHYLHSLLDVSAETRGIALDLSPAGLRRAAKHPRALALGVDLWGDLPLATNSVQGLINVFAPRHPAEYLRVLSPEAPVVIVIPRTDHLRELADGGLLRQQQDKREHVITLMAPEFGPLRSAESVTERVAVTAELAGDLVMMGPAGHHRSSQEVISSVEQAHIDSVSISVDVLTWSSPLG